MPAREFMEWLAYGMLERGWTPGYKPPPPEKPQTPEDIQRQLMAIFPLNHGS